MLFITPPLTEQERNALRRFDDLHHRLGRSLGSPRRWSGMLRRLALARNIQGSNSIEGYDTSIEDAVAAIDQKEPLDTSKAAWPAIVGYRNAMSYILQLSEDAHFAYSGQLIRSLHYMMLSYDADKHPGLWRPGPIYVTRSGSGIAYTGPDAGLVPSLIDELVDTLNTANDHHPVVEAAMAHLNLVMIHPFSDGNGRMARALQTLVLVRRGMANPVFSSIEEWLGCNTQDYTQILQDVGSVTWHPERDALPWIRFCLRAHYQCANRHLRFQELMGAIWDEVDQLIARHRLQPRTDIALVHTALGFRLRNSYYRSVADISSVMASRDLKQMVDAGLLTSRGERRGRYYIASDALLEVANKIEKRPEQNADPFAEVA